MRTTLNRTLRKALRSGRAAPTHLSPPTTFTAHKARLSFASSSSLNPSFTNTKHTSSASITSALIPATIPTANQTPKRGLHAKPILSSTATTPPAPRAVEIAPSSVLKLDEAWESALSPATIPTVNQTPKMELLSEPTLSTATTPPAPRAVNIRPSVMQHRALMATLSNNKLKSKNVNVVEILVPITSGEESDPYSQQIEIPTFNFNHINNNNRKPLPAIIYFPGSAWISYELKHSEYICSKLCELTGYRVISVFPRLAPEHRFPVPIFDAHKVIVHFKQFAHNYGIDPDYITTMGYSSGAYLAAQAGLLGGNDPAPTRLQTLVSPITDLSRTIEKFRHAQNQDTAISEDFVTWCIKNFTSRGLDLEDPRASFVFQTKDILKEMPETHLIFGEYDRCHGDSRVLEEKLKEANVPVESRILKNENHGHWWHSEEAVEIAAKHVKERVESKFKDPQHRVYLYTESGCKELFFDKESAPSSKPSADQEKTAVSDTPISPSPKP